MKIMFCSLFLVACGPPQKGDPGPAGPPGPTGAQGATGNQGIKGATGDVAVSSLFSATLFCQGELASTGIFFTYSAAVLKSGDVFASGSIRNNSFEISDSAFYAKAQNGADTASVIFQYDLQGAANAGWWEIKVPRTTLLASITYHDSDAVGGQTNWVMTVDKCLLSTY